MRLPWPFRRSGDPGSAGTAGEPGDKSPFVLSAAAEEPRGVLLVHGFTGTPFEMRPLGEELHRHGLHCAAPLLRGHGKGPAALAATTWSDWVGSAEAALLDLHNALLNDLAPLGRRPRLAVVGLSMGGLITLELCRRHPTLITAVALLATPLWLRPSLHRLIEATARTPLRHITVPKLIGSDVRDPAMRFKNPATPGIPLPALLSLTAFMAHARARLGEIEQPALVMHARQDHTVPYACMAALLAGLGTPAADLRGLTLENSYHLITLDVERQAVAAAVLRHLLHYLHEGPGAPPAA